MTENGSSKRSHFKVVGCLVPTNNRKAFRVFCEANGKHAFIGLIKKEDLVRSIEAKPMLVVEISRFFSKPSNDETRVSKGVGYPYSWKR